MEFNVRELICSHLLFQHKIVSKKCLAVRVLTRSQLSAAARSQNPTSHQASVWFLLLFMHIDNIFVMKIASSNDIVFSNRSNGLNNNRNTNLRLINKQNGQKCVEIDTKTMPLSCAIVDVVFFHTNITTLHCTEYIDGGSLAVTWNIETYCLCQGSKRNNKFLINICPIPHRLIWIRTAVLFKSNYRRYLSAQVNNFKGVTIYEFLGEFFTLSIQLLCFY